MSSGGQSEPAGRRKKRGGWLLLLLLLLLGAAFYLSAKGGFDWRARLAQLQEWAKPQPGAQVPQESAVIAPSFDIVRAEPGGALVAAGRAEPGWRVRIESQGVIVGEARADENGEWVVQPDKALPPGDHSLSLSATGDDGARTVTGTQRIALSIAPGAKDQPVVALTDQGKPTELLQQPEPSTAPAPLKADASPPPAAKPEAPRADAPAAAAPQNPAGPDAAEPVARVRFNAVDYENKEGGGVIFMNGQAAPGARVMLYINNAFAGLATAGADGRWTFSGARDLPSGTHQIRADQVENGGGKVLARAEVSFEHVRPDSLAKSDAAPGLPAAEPTPAPEAERRAPIQDSIEEARRQVEKPAPPPDGASRGEPPAQKSAALSARNSARNSRAAQTKRLKAARGCNVVVVRRGDSLWHIARRCYGEGERFTKIFRGNTAQIRNPNLIYPSQRFVVPR